MYRSQFSSIVILLAIFTLPASVLSAQHKSSQSSHRQSSSRYSSSQRNSASRTSVRQYSNNSSARISRSIDQSRVGRVTPPNQRLNTRSYRNTSQAGASTTRPIGLTKFNGAVKGNTSQRGTGSSLGFNSNSGKGGTGSRPSGPSGSDVFIRGSRGGRQSDGGSSGSKSSGSGISRSSGNEAGNSRGMTSSRYMSGVRGFPTPPPVKADGKPINRTYTSKPKPKNTGNSTPVPGGQESTSANVITPDTLKAIEARTGADGNPRASKGNSGGTFNTSPNGAGRISTRSTPAESNTAAATQGISQMQINQLNAYFNRRINPVIHGRAGK